MAIAGIGLVLKPGDHEHRSLDLAEDFIGQPIGRCEGDGTDVLTRERQPHGGAAVPLPRLARAVTMQFLESGSAMF
jgi:hypothetical protein